VSKIIFTAAQFAQCLVLNESLPLVYICQCEYTGQEKTQVWLPWASKFCSWAGKNGSLVGKWASGQVFKIYLSQYSNVSDNFQLKQFQNLRLQDEQNNEL